MKGKLALVISTMMIQAVTGSPVSSPSVSSPESFSLERRNLERRNTDAVYTVKKKCKFTKYGEAKPTAPPRTTDYDSQPKNEENEGEQNNNYQNEQINVNYEQEPAAAPKSEPAPKIAPKTAAAPEPVSKPAAAAAPKSKPKQNVAPKNDDEDDTPSYGNSFTNSCLKGHNKARKKVGLPPLKWSDQLASNAKSWSNKLASDDDGLNHSDGTGEGENLYSASGYGNNPNILCNRAVKAWVNERSLYEKQGKPAISYGSYEGWGHYTQIVWKDTHTVGCGVATSKSGKNYVTCRYLNAGNFIGQRPY